LKNCVADIAPVDLIDNGAARHLDEPLIRQQNTVFGDVVDDRALNGCGNE
jgi:hypothetical protein